MATNFINAFIANNTTGTSVIASGAINQSGIIYSVIIPSGSDTPTVQQVIDGEDSNGTPLSSNFISSAEASDSGVFVALSGYNLTSETDYKICLAASGYDDGLIDSVYVLSFTTPDVTAPQWLSGYPSVLSLSSSTASAGFRLNENGEAFYVCVPISETTPSHTQILAGTDANNNPVPSGLKGSIVLTANTVGYRLITGLDYRIGYKLCVTAFDDATPPNQINPSVTVVNFKTVVKSTGTGQFNINNIIKKRRNLVNQIVNTLRG